MSSQFSMTIYDSINELRLIDSLNYFFKDCCGFRFYKKQINFSPRFSELLLKTSLRDCFIVKFKNKIIKIYKDENESWEDFYQKCVFKIKNM